MKKFAFVVIASVAVFSLYGCGKKQQTLEEMQQPMSMETLTTMNTPLETKVSENKASVEVKAEAASLVNAKGVKLEPLPPAGPYKPTGTEIQTALKNAGFYTGAVDGKIGLMTKKAISEFQKANNLTADGKVGPKTWGVLSRHLSPEPASKAR